jgi:hypothetical protein
VTHSTAEINGQPLVKEYDDPYNKASNSVNIDINPNNEQTIKGEVDDSSKVIGDSPLFNRFGSDPDKTKQEVDDSSKSDRVGHNKNIKMVGFVSFAPSVLSPFESYYFSYVH